MSFIFVSHDGHTFRLDTQDGQVHCEELDAQVPPPASLEPSDDGDAA